jgi:hypothetical protein
MLNSTKQALPNSLKDNFSEKEKNKIEGGEIVY